MAETCCEVGTTMKCAVGADVEECAICWEPMPAVEAASLYYDLKKKACNHQFHEDCVKSMVQPWKCPLCRARFYKVSLHKPLAPLATFLSNIQPYTAPRVPFPRQTYGIIHDLVPSSNVNGRINANRHPTGRFTPEIVAATITQQIYGTPIPGQYSLEVLQSTFPEGVDPTKKEEYLSDEVFLAVFGMSKSDFAGLPKWRRNGLKKKHNLF